MLPTRSGECGGKPDGRYGDEAVRMLMNEIKASGLSHREFQVKLFGGGNMFPRQCAGKYHVGLNNIRMARKLVSLNGFNCTSEHLGGTGHRHVIFDIKSGNAWVRHVELADMPIDTGRIAATA